MFVQVRELRFLSVPGTILLSVSVLTAFVSFVTMFFSPSAARVSCLREPPIYCITLSIPACDLDFLYLVVVFLGK